MSIIALHHLSFEYPGGTRVLSDVCLSINKGDFCVISGLTGSGKTTLLKCLKPEISPVGTYGGRIELFGKSLVAPYSPREIGAIYDSDGLLIGYVSQDPGAQIVCDRVWRELAFGVENLGCSQDAIDWRIAEVASFFGIESWLEMRTSELSGGKMQMLNLASVLAMHPSVVLLDEPTAQLDPIASDELISMLFRLNRRLGVTIVVSAHSLDEFAPFANRAYLLSDGKVESVLRDDLNSFPEITTSSSCVQDEEEDESLVNACIFVEDDAAISVKDVSFNYEKNSPQVLTCASVELAKSKITAIVGANGSGKSTLLKLIAGIYKPRTGKIENKLKESQAYMPQDARLLFSCETVLEELTCWCDLVPDPDNMAHFLKERGLANKAELNPLDLSYGEQKCLAFYKLMILEPELLLLDEPVCGLDSIFKANMACEFKRLVCAGATIVFVTHDLEFASLVADDVAMVFDHSIMHARPAQEFFDDALLYKPISSEFTRVFRSQDERRE